VLQAEVHEAVCNVYCTTVQYTLRTNNTQKLKHSLQHGYHSKPITPKLQCGNSTEQSQAPDDEYINLSTSLMTTIVVVPHR